MWMFVAFLFFTLLQSYYRANLHPVRGGTICALVFLWSHFCFSFRFWFKPKQNSLSAPPPPPPAKNPLVLSKSPPALTPPPASPSSSSTAPSPAKSSHLSPAL